MKHIVPLIVASFMLAIATAMLNDGPFTLPFLVGYLLGIVVPVVVFTGILTLVVAGIHHVYTRKDMPNLFQVMWGIWVLVAGVNFFGNYQNQQEARIDQAYLVEDESGRPSAILTLQSRFVRDSRQLDTELASKVATVRIPPLFDSVFLEDKSHFPAAIGQLEDYGQLFREHKKKQTEILAKMKSGVEQLDLPQDERRQAVQEFNNTYEIDGALSREYFDIVIEVSQQGVEYLEFLEHTPYEVSNGQVVFEMDPDSEKYKEYLQTFNRLSEQEVSTQRELADSRKKRMTRMRALSR